MLGKTVTVVVDRPFGTLHPEYDDIIYTVNYGYIDGVIAEDGEEQDAYILGVDKPISEFTGKVIAIIHRKGDIEDKLVVAPEECKFTMDEIRDTVAFQEKYFDIEIIM